MGLWALKWTRKIDVAVFFGWLLRLANSIYRLPPLLPPVCHVNLVVALEGEEEVVVDREGQKGCAVFRVVAVLCQIGAGGALELARLQLRQLVAAWIGNQVEEWRGTLVVGPWTGKWMRKRTGRNGFCLV